MSEMRLTLDEMVRLGKLVNNWRGMLFSDNFYMGSIEDLTLMVELEEPNWQHICRSAYRLRISQGNSNVGEYCGRNKRVQEVYFHAQCTASQKSVEYARKLLQGQKND